MAGDNQLAPSVFEFDLTVFRLAAIQKAAYRFTGEFNVQMERLSEPRMRVALSPRVKLPSLDPQSFSNEVLDQELREVVAEETRSVRELLLAQAFSGLSLVDPLGEGADFHADPLGIATPPDNASPSTPTERA